VEWYMCQNFSVIWQHWVLIWLWTEHADDWQIFFVADFNDFANEMDNIANTPLCSCTHIFLLCMKT
jgi:hypothetical protein